MDNDKLEIHAYIKDYQGLSKSFQICYFKYRGRSKNGIAHLHATEGLRQKEQWNMSRGVPIFAKEEVKRERLHSLPI
ncbi:hypothetical protein Gogos_015070 [Gossypium gossypioides]|uniref:Uncharacterized protein n=1 Tax=Gossypium gossypioides TaxID=34282 RepID=A0A7J9C0H3_GOSGO|nr:hypothetical protein [Gossypium gossypioides]